MIHADVPATLRDAHDRPPPPSPFPLPFPLPSRRFRHPAPLSVELGPGLLDNIFDGIQRPLRSIANQAGDCFIPRGVNVPALDKSKAWAFEPAGIKVGDRITGGDIFGVVQVSTGTRISTFPSLCPHTCPTPRTRTRTRTRTSCASGRLTHHRTPHLLCFAFPSFSLLPPPSPSFPILSFPSPSFPFLCFPFHSFPFLFFLFLFFSSSFV